MPEWFVHFVDKAPLPVVIAGYILAMIVGTAIVSILLLRLYRDRGKASWVDATLLGIGCVMLAAPITRVVAFSADVQKLIDSVKAEAAAEPEEPAATAGEPARPAPPAPGSHESGNEIRRAEREINRAVDTLKRVF